MRQLRLNWNGVVRDGEQIWIRLPNERVIVTSLNETGLLNTPEGCVVPVAPYRVLFEQDGHFVVCDGYHDLRGVALT